MDGGEGDVRESGGGVGGRLGEAEGESGTAAPGMCACAVLACSFGAASSSWSTPPDARPACVLELPAALNAVP